MKKLIYSLLIGLIVTFTSCDKTSDDTSKVTNFVNFEMKGESMMLIALGSTYTEPGVIAMEGENDITSTMKTTGTVDASKAGVYHISYSAKNMDGFAKSIQRTVYVYDPTITTDISGTYTTAAGSRRYWIEDGAEVPCVGYKVTISELAPGIFNVSDLMGGYYDQGLNRGSAYAMEGTIKLNSDNTIEALSGFVQAWGDSYDSFDNGKLVPETEVISWELPYAKQMIFYVTLNK